MGANPLAGKVYWVDSRSLGATSNAPLMTLWYFVAQCAMVAQPRLCPINTTFDKLVEASAVSMVCIQSLQLGASHSFCCMS